MAHFLAVAVIQSNRSPPSLRIQDEYGSLLTVCFEENTKHMGNETCFLPFWKQGSGEERYGKIHERKDVGKRSRCEDDIPERQ